MAKKYYDDCDVIFMIFFDEIWRWCQNAQVAYDNFSHFANLYTETIARLQYKLQKIWFQNMHMLAYDEGTLILLFQIISIECSTNFDLNGGQSHFPMCSVVNWDIMETLKLLEQSKEQFGKVNFKYH